MEQSNINVQSEKTASQLYEHEKRIIEFVIEAEEKVIGQVAKRLLGREPISSDAVRFTKINHQTNPLNYHILFDGIPIGTISKKVNGTCAVEFIPHKDFQ